MELEKMGFDLTVLAYVIFGNAALVVTGACLISLLKRIIRTDNDEAAFSAHTISNTNAFTGSPTDIVEFIELNAYSNMETQPKNEEKVSVMHIPKEKVPNPPLNLEIAIGY